MTETESFRIMENHARITKFPAGSWRVTYGAIFGFGTTRPAALSDAARQFAQQQPASDAGRGPDGRESVP